MTLPSVTPVNGCDDDSDMFGPPRSSPPIGYHHHRSRVPMISPKLRQREERKRILQLCAHKLERIKDSETNLRRSVCINNTYCRLTDELRREKQSRYLANLPRSESKPETARDNIFNPYNSCGIDNSNHHQLTANKAMAHGEHVAHQNPINSMKSIDHCSDSNVLQSNHCNMNIIINENSPCDSHSSTSASLANTLTATTIATQATTATTISTTITTNATSSIRKRQLCSSNIDNDLEILDRELREINSPMPLIDPEITQGAEQLEKAISSRKRQRSEDESDRLVREALSQFYIPPQRLISAIEDCPLDIVNMGSISPKCPKMPNGSNDLELDFDMNQNQKEFEVIMDALRLGSPSPTPSVGSDTCGQAAMMSETNGGVFHNLVVTSLET